jgi:hypothetical protein
LLLFPTFKKLRRTVMVIPSPMTSTVASLSLFPEDQVQELNFIVEGCVFRGDIEIPTPPPPDSEQDDSRAPWELEDLPEFDYDYYQAPWEGDEDIATSVSLRMNLAIVNPALSLNAIFRLLRSPDHVVRSAATLRQMSLTVTSLTRSDQSLPATAKTPPHRLLHRELLRLMMPVLRVRPLPQTLLLED